MVVTVSGFGFFLSALALQFRDVRNAMGFLIQVLLYVTPIAWPLSLVPSEYQPLYAMYPMVGVVEGFRAAIIGVNPMPWLFLAEGAVSAVAVLILGLAYFRRKERSFADVA
jgi:lipopolysaccharide transport system permease protein